MTILYCLVAWMFWNSRANELPSFEALCIQRFFFFSKSPLDFMKVTDKHVCKHNALWHCSRAPPENLQKQSSSKMYAFITTL